MNASLYKKAGENQFGVKTFCSYAHGTVRLMDNGNGHVIARGNPTDFMCGEYAPCFVEVVTADRSEIVLWLRRK